MIQFPHDADMERAALGVAMSPLTPRCSRRIVLGLPPAAFYSGHRRTLFHIIRTLGAGGVPDPLLVRSHLLDTKAHRRTHSELVESIGAGIEGAAAAYAARLITLMKRRLRIHELGQELRELQEIE